MAAPVSMALLRGAMDDIWSKIDGIFDTFSEADWERKHGKDWTMRDLPYHLAYFDREVVAAPLEAGGQVPSGLPPMRTMAELDAWNAAEFARRPAGQTVEESLVEMRAARERIRAAIEGWGDGELSKPVYAPLMDMGLRTAGFALRSVVAHTWSEYAQLLIRMKRTGPMPKAETTHLALDSFMHMFPMGMSRAAVAATPFALRFRFEGDGGGVWLIRGSASGADVREDEASPADVEMRMKALTFAKLWAQMQNPMVLMLTRQVRMKGFRKMGRMSKVFPDAKPDMPMDPTLISM